MRNPYVVGGWVSGHEHYGRTALIKHILDSPNDALWVIGNRRIGKTSLLRQLEFLTADSDRYVPLYWDMQGSTTLMDLGAELIYVIEDEAERFQNLVVDVDLLRNWDAVGVIRLLRRYARAANRTLLLLGDEAEALIEIAKTDPDGLARLRKAFQSGTGLRVVLAATKVLSRINDLSRDWPTSPFLFGLGLRNLTSLTDEEAAALIRQDQSSQPVEVSAEQVQQIRQITHNHPYLIQMLCSRLFTSQGTLRQIDSADLALDSTLEGYFQIDFRWLSPGERQVLLSIVEGNDTIESITARTGLSLVEVQEFVYSQQRLGQIRQIAGGNGLDTLRLAPGNLFLQRWLEKNYDDLVAEAHNSVVRDESTRDLVREAQAQEMQYVQEQLRVQLANLQELERQRAQFGIRVPLDLVNDINRVKMEIQRLEERLALILPEIIQTVKGQGMPEVV